MMMAAAAATVAAAVAVAVAVAPVVAAPSGMSCARAKTAAGLSAACGSSVSPSADTGAYSSMRGAN